MTDASRCPLCGEANACPMAAGTMTDAPCWCASVTISEAALARVPEEQRGVSCLCRACATTTPAED